MAKIITQHHPFYEKILKAEQALTELNIIISVDCSTGGIILRDTTTGLEVRDSELNDEFPRFVDSSFIVIE